MFSTTISSIPPSHPVFAPKFSKAPEIKQEIRHIQKHCVEEVLEYYPKDASYLRGTTAHTNEGNVTSKEQPPDNWSYTAIANEIDLTPTHTLHTEFERTMYSYSCGHVLQYYPLETAYKILTYKQQEGEGKISPEDFQTVYELYHSLHILLELTPNECMKAVKAEVIFSDLGKSETIRTAIANGPVNPDKYNEFLLRNENHLEKLDCYKDLNKKERELLCDWLGKYGINCGYAAQGENGSEVFEPLERLKKSDLNSKQKEGILKFNLILFILDVMGALAHLRKFENLWTNYNESTHYNIQILLKTCLEFLNDNNADDNQTKTTLYFKHLSARCQALSCSDTFSSGIVDENSPPRDQLFALLVCLCRCTSEEAKQLEAVMSNLDENVVKKFLKYFGHDGNIPTTYIPSFLRNFRFSQFTQISVGLQILIWIGEKYLASNIKGKEVLDVNPISSVQDAQKVFDNMCNTGDPGVIIRQDGRVIVSSTDSTDILQNLQTQVA